MARSAYSLLAGTTPASRFRLRDFGFSGIVPIVSSQENRRNSPRRAQRRGFACLGHGGSHSLLSARRRAGDFMRGGRFSGN